MSTSSETFPTTLAQAKAMPVPPGYTMRGDLSVDLGANIFNPMTIIPFSSVNKGICVPVISAAIPAETGATSFAFSGSPPRTHAMWISRTPLGPVFVNTSYKWACSKQGPEGSVFYTHDPSASQFLCRLTPNAGIFFVNFTTDGCAPGSNCAAYFKIA